MAFTTASVLSEPFMSLAAEVRNNIYRFLFYSPWPLRFHKSGRHFYGARYGAINDADRPDFRIIACCKTIRNEAVPILFDINNFFIYQPTEMTFFAKNASIYRIKFNSIQQITLHHRIINRTRVKELRQLANLKTLTVLGVWAWFSLGKTGNAAIDYPCEFVNRTSSNTQDEQDFDWFLRTWKGPSFPLSGELKEVMVARPEIKYEAAIEEEEASDGPRTVVKDSMVALAIFELTWKEDTQRYRLVLETKAVGATYINYRRTHGSSL